MSDFYLFVLQIYDSIILSVYSIWSGLYSYNFCPIVSCFPQFFEYI